MILLHSDVYKNSRPKRFQCCSMIICPNCKWENEDDDIFCGNCGYNLSFYHSNVQTESPPIGSDALARYQQIEDRIAGLEGIEDQVNQAYQYHQSLKSEAKRIEIFYKRKQEEARKEFKDVEELKKLTWKSLKSRVSGRKEELLRTEEKEYFEAINKEEQAKKDFHEIIKRVNTAYKQLTDLQNLAKTRLSLENELEELLDGLYKGVVGDEIENNLERELKNLIQEKNPINVNQSQLKTALGHLTNARDHFSEGLSKLDSAKGYSNWDTFFGGGFFVDSMKHGRVSDARNAVQQGHYSLERAFATYPKLPSIRRANVQEGNYFWDTFFDNIFSDMQARQRIEESQYSVQITLNDINSTISWVKREIDNLLTELTKSDNKIARQRRDLTNRRRELIEAQIRTKKGNQR